MNEKKKRIEVIFVKTDPETFLRRRVFGSYLPCIFVIRTNSTYVQLVATVIYSHIPVYRLPASIVVVVVVEKIAGAPVQQLRNISKRSCAEM